MENSSYSPHNTRKKLLWALGIFALFIFSSVFTHCDFAFFWSRKSHLTDIISAMFPPDTSYTGKIVMPLIATIKMSVTGTFLGAFLALIAAPFCAQSLRVRRAVRFVMRFIIQILRSFPALILALIATFIFGLGVFAGTVAITLYTFAIMTRLTYEDIEGTSLLAYDALLSMGVSKSKSYFRVIIPEIAPSYLTNALYLLETNVRHSSILGYVGAGGIGLLLNEKISWREYDKVAMILLMLFLAVCVIELLSHFLSQIVSGRIRASKKATNAIIALLALLFVFCTVTLSGPDFSHTSTHVMRNMLLGFIHPDTEFLFDLSSAGLLYLLVETICISVVGTLLGTVLAVPLSFLNAPRLVPKPIALFFRVLIMAIRSTPFIIYGLIFIRVSGPGAFTGVLTLAFCSIGLLSKRFTEAIDALDFRSYYALEAMGVPTLLRIRYAVIPQLFPAFASAVLYRFDVNIREASVLGLVGAGGIGAPLVFAMNHFDWSRSGAICLGLIIAVFIIDMISVRIRKRI